MAPEGFLFLGLILVTIGMWWYVTRVLRHVSKTYTHWQQSAEASAKTNELARASNERIEDQNAKRHQENLKHYEDDLRRYEEYAGRQDEERKLTEEYRLDAQRAHQANIKGNELLEETNKLLRDLIDEVRHDRTNR